MNIEKKLKKANELNERINEIKDFINLAKSAQSIDEKNAKVNELNGINRFYCMKIVADISTGTKSPSYEKSLHNDDVIVALMTCGLAGVEEKLKETQEELNYLINPPQQIL